MLICTHTVIFNKITLCLYVIVYGDVRVTHNNVFILWAIAVDDIHAIYVYDKMLWAISMMFTYSFLISTSEWIIILFKAVKLHVKFAPR